jgi:hypothetical protein
MSIGVPGAAEIALSLTSGIGKPGLKHFSDLLQEEYLHVKAGLPLQLFSWSKGGLMRFFFYELGFKPKEVFFFPYNFSLGPKEV